MSSEVFKKHFCWAGNRLPSMEGLAEGQIAWPANWPSFSGFGQMQLVGRGLSEDHRGVS